MNIINNIIKGLKNEENEKKNKKIKKKRTIEIHGITDLPKKGWIQGCYTCDTPTSRTNIFDNNLIENKFFKFKVYICKDCNRQNILKKEKVICKLNNYIYNNILDN